MKLTAVERVEYFEQGLQRLLGDLSASKSTAVWTTSIADLLRQSWSADRCSVWYLEPKLANETDVPAKADTATSVTGTHNFANPQSATDPLTSDPKATKRIIEVACVQPGILWIEPAKSSAAYRAIGRVPLQPSIASAVAIELEMAKSVDGTLVLPRDAILTGFDRCLQLLGRFDPVWQNASEELRSLARIVNSTALDAMLQRRVLCEKLTERLAALATKKLSTFEDRQNVTRLIQTLLAENGLSLECPTCGEPSVLRCLKTGNSQQGCFLFDHRIKGKRTMHGGKSELPSIVVLDKPDRRAALPLKPSIVFPANVAVKDGVPPESTATGFVS